MSFQLIRPTTSTSSTSSSSSTSTSPSTALVGNSFVLSDLADMVITQDDIVMMFDLTNTFGYTGFDITVTFLELKKKFHKNYTIRIFQATNTSTSSGVPNAPYFDADEFKSEMLALASWIASRGTNVKTDGKALQRTGEEGKSIMLKLVAKYEIVRSVPKANTDITMGRIAAVLARQIAEFYVLQGNSHKIVGDSGQCPHYLCFPAGASLIPKGDTVLFNAWKGWQSSFTAAIGSDTTEAQQATYAKTINDSLMYTDAQRKNFLSYAQIKSGKIVIDPSKIVMTKSSTDANKDLGNNLQNLAAILATMAPKS